MKSVHTKYILLYLFYPCWKTTAKPWYQKMYHEWGGSHSWLKNQNIYLGRNRCSCCKKLVVKIRIKLVNHIFWTIYLLLSRIFWDQNDYMCIHVFEKDFFTTSNEMKKGNFETSTIINFEATIGMFWKSK